MCRFAWGRCSGIIDEGAGVAQTWALSNAGGELGGEVMLTYTVKDLLPLPDDSAAGSSGQADGGDDRDFEEEEDIAGTDTPQRSASR